jgi:Type I restriction-modification system methyltransferase subunit
MTEKKKREALSVTRLINEVLVGQLSIPLRQIVNDTSFEKYTGSKRPDILISEFEFDGNNEEQFIENLIAYAEVKDNCLFEDKDWLDAITQGIDKSEKLKLPYFIVTNCEKTVFYNSKTLEMIKLNGNQIRDFQTIDIFRLIKNKLSKDPGINDIKTNVDSVSAISEAVFNKKLWELANIYRSISFKNNVQKIDFTIGFISLEFFEEKANLEGTKDRSLTYWSECADDNKEKLVGNILQYINRLERETDFKDFKELMNTVKSAIYSDEVLPLIDKDNVYEIYKTIDSMRPLHGTGFDLFGAVYEMFASPKEKKDFGEYFTRRHYTHILSKLLLEHEQYFNSNRRFKLLDPACGTGGFLTESFKILKNNYEKTNTINPEAKKFLEKECFHGIDIRNENIFRTKLNMFLVGDGHTNMFADDSLKRKFKSDHDYIITNPPYGAGTIEAGSENVSSKRMEIAFLFKIINILKDGGKACVILPDGVLENPSLSKLRKEFLEKCEITSVISLPKFAFAPYTKEKTFAVFFIKNNEYVRKIQRNPIWMYIVDNDGLANSDKRYPTKLRNNRNGWMHDEISGWVSTDGEEMPGLLEERWMKYDDSACGGTQWINERGQTVKLRKGGFIEITNINEDTYFTLIPEYYLRPFEPNFVTLEQLKEEIGELDREFRAMIS